MRHKFLRFHSQYSIMLICTNVSAGTCRCGRYLSGHQVWVAGQQGATDVAFFYCNSSGIAMKEGSGLLRAPVRHDQRRSIWLSSFLHVTMVEIIIFCS